jgi:glycosyltransferase involved in cell wall biosynthesis
MSDVQLSVVVPVYNEEESLGRLHDEISAGLKGIKGGYEVILVDDGSRDRSFEICRELNRKDPEHIRAIRFRRNFGQTAAMAAGFHAARGQVVACLDADLQNDPADIPRMLEEMEKGYDVVSGWRADRKDKFISRRLPSMIANALIARTTGVHIHDYGCTLKLYRREVIDNMDLYGELHRFLPALASWSGAEVKEMKVNHRARQFGTSKYGIGRTVNVMLDLVTVKFLLSSSTKPMRVLGKWGFLMLAGGGVSTLLAIMKKIISGNMANSPWMFIAITLFLGGLQLISMGLLAEIGVRTYFESQNKRIYTIRETVGGE